MKSTHKFFDVIIIGAGASGLMCAIEAGKRGRKVLILEKSHKIASKIHLAGGGRCNFTNLQITPDSYISNNPHFCKSALSKYTQWDFISFIERYNLTWHEKKLGQLFCDQKSIAVVQALLNECQQYGVEILQNCTINTIKNNFSINTNKGNFQTKSLVIASGGVSVPKIGATDFGIKIAKQFGIKTIPFRAGLVPFIFTNHCFTDLSGTVIDAIVSYNNISFHDSILITHKGLSGPAILQISSYWHSGDAIKINLLPKIDACKWLLDVQKNHPKIILKTALSIYLSKQLSEKLVAILTNFAGLPLSQINQNELKLFGKKLNNWNITPNGTEGLQTAEVSVGGVSTDEISSKTFESKKIPGLFFVGETVDVTGWLGGYNLQWSWSSGFAAGHFV